MTKLDLTHLKDGDIVNGRPVRILDPYSLEATEAAVIGADSEAADKFYGGSKGGAAKGKRPAKGSPEAKAAMKKLRAKRGKAKKESKGGDEKPDKPKDEPKGKRKDSKGLLGLFAPSEK